MSWTFSSYDFVRLSAKQAAKDISYGTIILVGGLTLAAIFYYLFSELFSRENPSGIYDESSKICLDNLEVIIKLQQKKTKLLE